MRFRELEPSRTNAGLSAPVPQLQAAPRRECLAEPETLVRQVGAALATPAAERVEARAQEGAATSKGEGAGRVPGVLPAGSLEAQSEVNG